MKKFEIFKQKGLEIEKKEPRIAHQFNLNGDMKDNIGFFISLSDLTLKEELKSYRREPTEKSIDYIKDLTTNKKNNTYVGVKFKFLQYSSFAIYEEWEGGYMEFFLRVSSSEHIDYFIWCYLKMKHLEKVYNRFNFTFDL